MASGDMTPIENFPSFRVATGSDGVTHVTFSHLCKHHLSIMTRGKMTFGTVALTTAMFNIKRPSIKPLSTITLGIMGLNIMAKLRHSSEQ